MFSVKLANFEMFTASEESTVKCLDRLDFRRPPGPVFDPSRRGRVRVRVAGGGAHFPEQRLVIEPSVLRVLRKSSEINCRNNDGRKCLGILNKTILAFPEPFSLLSVKKNYCFTEFFTVTVEMPKI